MHRFLAIIIAAPVMAIVAIAAGNLTTGKSGDADAAGTASARTEAAPIVLTQYNPCPNGKCR
jgi:hypothetical protein